MLSHDNKVTRGATFLHHTVAANTLKMLDAYEQQANHLVPGSSCELDSYFGLGGTGDLSGFHIVDADDEFDIWMWKIRTVSDCNFGVCACDVTINLWSVPETPADTDRPPTTSIMTPLDPEVESNGNRICGVPMFVELLGK